MKSTESDVCYFEVDAVFNREPVELLEESTWTAGFYFYLNVFLHQWYGCVWLYDTGGDHSDSNVSQVDRVVHDADQQRLSGQESQNQDRHSHRPAAEYEARRVSGMLIRTGSTLLCIANESVPKLVINNTITTTLHSFNGPLSGTTQVSQYQKGKTNLDFTEARDSEWQWHQLGHMQVCNSLQTDNHASSPPLSSLWAGCRSCRPTNSVKALKA